MKCTYKYKQGSRIYICNKESTHVHSNGKPLCERHFNKTIGGTISTLANKHRNIKPGDRTDTGKP
jgi:hypothetical protein